MAKKQKTNPHPADSHPKSEYFSPTTPHSEQAINTTSPLLFRKEEKRKAKPKKNNVKKQDTKGYKKKTHIMLGGEFESPFPAHSEFGFLLGGRQVNHYLNQADYHWTMEPCGL